MFDEQYWEYVSPSGVRPWHWLDEEGYEYAEAGENLAKNFITSDTTVSAWMASPTHKENLLKSEYKDVGFAVKHGILNDKETTIIVALYGSLRDNGESTQSEASVAASDVNAPMSTMTRIGLGLKTLSPVVIASIVVLLILSNISLVAHTYRHKLPKNIRQSWRRYHGIIKAVWLAVLAIVLVLAYMEIGQL